MRAKNDKPKTKQRSDCAVKTRQKTALRNAADGESHASGEKMMARQGARAKLPGRPGRSSRRNFACGGATAEAANQPALERRSDRLPRYLQIASALRRRIRDGVWQVGEKIATLERLEAEFGVARVTVRQAVEMLQAEGLLKSFQGRGTFVTKSPDIDRWLQLATDWDSLIAPIRNNRLELLSVEHGRRPHLRDGEGIAGPDYTYIHSVQSRGDEPYAVARVYLARSLYDQAPQRFAVRPALAVLAEMQPIARAHQTLSINAADVETARHLKIDMNAPTAEARCLAADRSGVVLYVGDIIYRGEVVRLNIALRENRPEFGKAGIARKRRDE
jgi:GntR family transcriptional regulator